MQTRPHFKDAILNDLAERANVAQFVSFDPEQQQRFARIHDHAPNRIFESVKVAIQALLEKSPEHRINIRSFHPEQPQGHEFIYGLSTPEQAIDAIERLTAQGLFVIANETVDVNDGGVSGVVHGDVMEFAPGGTPRIVESGKVVSVSRTMGKELLQWVYGFGFELDLPNDIRVEFSLHPQRRGYRREHVIVWEIEKTANSPSSSFLTWPNRFSEMLGDKAFGLLVAAALDLRVPSTTVMSRTMRPFTFGTSTGSDVVWMRTCPARPEPGMFPTVRGWSDPFALIQGVNDSWQISSVLIQNEVQSVYSGAVLTSSNREAIVEGVAGFGEEFMLGRAQPTGLPDAVTNEVIRVHSVLLSSIGSARAEWAFDGSYLWILQVQPEEVLSEGMTIVPGCPEREVEFDVDGGLNGLRELVSLLIDKNVGIRLKGRIGVTSHIADVLRRHKIPSRMVPKESAPSSVEQT